MITTLRKFTKIVAWNYLGSWLLWMLLVFISPWGSTFLNSLGLKSEHIIYFFTLSTIVVFILGIINIFIKPRSPLIIFAFLVAFVLIIWWTERRFSIVSRVCDLLNLESSGFVVCSDPRFPVPDPNFYE